MKFFCRIGLHDWLYSHKNEIKKDGCTVSSTHPLRQCSECEKKQYGAYDMMYGSTDWEDGWPEFIMVTYPPEPEKNA